MRQSTTMVYWFEDGQPNFKQFEGSFSYAPFISELRVRQAKGEPIAFIAVITEGVEGNVTLPGVDAPAADYDWTKRRPENRHKRIIPSK